MQGLLRSCFGVGVAIGVLGRELEGGGSGGEGVVVDLERQAGYHDAFMVPGVKVRS